MSQSTFNYVVIIAIHFSSMKILLDEIARLLRCTPSALRRLLKYSKQRRKVERQFLYKRVRTTYPNRHGKQCEFLLVGITKKGANEIRPFVRFLKSYNYDCNRGRYIDPKCQRIRLVHPNLQCAIQILPNGKRHVHPLELLELLERDVSSDKVKSRIAAEFRLDFQFQNLSLNSEKEQSAESSTNSSDCSVSGWSLERAKLSQSKDD